MRRYISEETRRQASIQSFREKLEKGADKKVKELGHHKPVRPPQKIAAPVQERMIRKLHAEDQAIDAIAVKAEIPEAAEALLDLSKHPEINPDDYHPDNVIIDEGEPENPEKADKRRIMRALKQTDTEKTERVQTIISRHSTAVAFNPNDSSHDSKTTEEFNHNALLLNNNANPDIHDVNAVQMVMENILDWDYHAHYHGETMTQDVFKMLITSLKMNLEAACPSSVQKSVYRDPDANRVNETNKQFIALADDVLELYELLTIKNWIGDLPHIYERTRQVVAGFLNAQNGDFSHLQKQKAEMEKISLWYQRHFYEVEAKAVSEAQIARLLERRDNPSQKLSP